MKQLLVFVWLSSGYFSVISLYMLGIHETYEKHLPPKEVIGTMAVLSTLVFFGCSAVIWYQA